MIKGTVEYKGEYIAPGSHAMELYEAKKWQELDKHLAELNRVYKKMRGE